MELTVQVCGSVVVRENRERPKQVPVYDFVTSNLAPCEKKLLSTDLTTYGRFWSTARG